MKKEIPKIETAEDWAKAKNFVPKKGQIIIYEGKKTGDDYLELPKMKIGDGIHTVSELPFKEEQKVSYLKEEQILVIN